MSLLRSCCGMTTKAKTAAARLVQLPASAAALRLRHRPAAVAGTLLVLNRAIYHYDSAYKKGARCHLRRYDARRGHHSKSLVASSFLPSTKDEPRLPKSDDELLERIRPLSKFWNFDSPKDFARALGLRMQQQGDNGINGNSKGPPPDGPIIARDRLVSILTLPLPGEPGWSKADTDESDDGNSSEVLQSLYATANATCEMHHGDHVHYRGLLEFSNICRCDCNYCGIRKSYRKQRQSRAGRGGSTPLERYLLDEATILVRVPYICDRDT